MKQQIFCWTNLFFLLLPTVVFSQDCNSPSFIPYKDHSLLYHVIATYQVTYEWGCVTKCQEDCRCHSFNFQYKNLAGRAYHTCELNSATRDTNGGTFFYYRKGFTYYESEKVAVPPLAVGSRQNPGKSCRQILLSLGSANSGQYWIDPIKSGFPFTVYCDMCTDGGGWTLIKRTVLKSSRPLLSYESVSDYRKISEQIENRVVDAVGLKNLKQDMGFDQLRFYCKKKSHGRTVHIMTNNSTLGRDAVRSMIVNLKPRAIACNSYTALYDDTSILSRKCLKWGYDRHFEVNRWGSDWIGIDMNIRLYHRSAFWNNGNSTSYFIVFIPKPSYRCDDSSNEVAKGDTFEIYVR